MLPENIVLDMSNKDYHNHAAISCSGLKLINRSPAHYFARYLSPEREIKEPTPAMKVGTLWHTMIFEPGAFDKRYVVMPDGLDRRTKEGKALWNELVAGGQEPITSDTLRQISSMSIAAETPFYIARNGICGYSEASIFWNDAETGVTCKIRPDYFVAPCEVFPNGLIVDGKTCEDASKEGFIKSVWNYEYHLQNAFYADGFQKVFGTEAPPEFIFLAQEKEAPYLTACYTIPASMIDYGRAIYGELLNTAGECIHSNTWPGYPAGVSELEPTDWMNKQIMGAGEVVEIAYAAE